MIVLQSNNFQSNIFHAEEGLRIEKYVPHLRVNYG